MDLVASSLTHLMVWDRCGYKRSHNIYFLTNSKKHVKIRFGKSKNKKGNFHSLKNSCGI